MVIFLLVVYCSCIGLVSLAGGALPSRMRLSHTTMQIVMSFVGGLMLGVALLHLLPHSMAETKSIDGSVGATMIGLLFMFFLIRVFHVHQHEPGETGETVAVAGESDHAHAGCDHEHHEHHDHGHSAAHGQTHCQLSGHGWMGLFIGLALHTLLDGMALAASVASHAHAGMGLEFVGLGTFLAVFLHKPLDAFSITSVMTAARWPTAWVKLVNLGFALTCPLGAFAFFFGVQSFDGQDAAIGYALAFSAGVFLCISLADILPEVQFHVHDKGKLTAALFFGVFLAWLIGWFEPEREHQHAPAKPLSAAHSE